MMAHGKSTLNQVKNMTTTFEAVAEIISDTSDIPLDEITPEKNAFTDLGIDSLDFLDIAFAIDKNFGIKIPLEKWTEELNENKASVDEYFILSKLCDRIDELIAAKDA
jgi:acyl carrier protein